MTPVSKLSCTVASCVFTKGCLKATEMTNSRMKRSSTVLGSPRPRICFDDGDFVILVPSTRWACRPSGASSIMMRNGFSSSKTTSFGYGAIFTTAVTMGDPHSHWPRWREILIWHRGYWRPLRRRAEAHSIGLHARAFTVCHAHVDILGTLAGGGFIAHHRSKPAAPAAAPAAAFWLHGLPRSLSHQSRRRCPHVSLPWPCAPSTSSYWQHPHVELASRSTTRMGS